MDNAMKVTIGIPFYNSELYLHDAIQSVLNQTYTDFELILSNDGSTDQSLEIASSFTDKRIKVVSDGQNRGLIYRLNEQINLANGEYFARMDSDDIMFPDRIEKQFNYLDKSPSIDIIGSEAIVIDKDNAILGIRYSKIPKKTIDILKSSPFIHPTVMGRTRWFKEYYYSSEMDGFEDADLWIRTFSQSKYSIISEPLLFYRDPLKIKIDTYLFRLKQARKAYHFYSKSGLLNNQLFALLLLSYTKSFIYNLTSKFGIVSFVVSKRNHQLELENRNLYIRILSKILSSDRNINSINN
jgi:glycosyltransferase involved in cell wall biosynthesis